MIDCSNSQLLTRYSRRNLEEIDACGERVVEGEGGRGNPSLRNIYGQFQASRTNQVLVQGRDLDGGKAKVGYSNLERVNCR
jgi:hypothetical protein